MWVKRKQAVDNSQVFEAQVSDLSKALDFLPYVMRCAIWYYLYNLKNVKNTHGGVLILVAGFSLQLY